MKKRMNTTTDFKIDLFDLIIHQISISQFEATHEMMDLKDKLEQWLSQNQDDGDFMLLDHVKDQINIWNIWKLKMELLPELIKKRYELATSDDFALQKDQLILEKKNELILKKKEMVALKIEQIRAEKQVAMEKNKAAESYYGKENPPPEASEQAIQRLKNVDRAIEILAGDIFALEQTLSGVGCQLCGQQAKFVCKTYYCGQACQAKHFNK